MDLLTLKENQIIVLNKEKYRILNCIKYTEKSSYWLEYKIKNIEHKETYYLNVEISGKAILYQILKDTDIKPNMNISYDGDDYELYEKGQAIVTDYIRF